MTHFQYKLCNKYILHVGKVDDFQYFACSSSFYFLSIEFHSIFFHLLSSANLSSLLLLNLTPPPKVVVDELYL